MDSFILKIDISFIWTYNTVIRTQKKFYVHK